MLCRLALCILASLASSAHAQSELALRFATYLGGDGATVGLATAIGPEGSVYVAAVTTAPDLPTMGAVQTYAGGADLYIARLSATGALEAATYLGGLGAEAVTALAVDDTGRLCLTGTTTSDDFPTRQPVAAYGGGPLLGLDGFVACLSADGSALDFATHLGGSGEDVLTALAVAPDGSLIVAGGTSSDDLPMTTGAAQPDHAGGDLFRTDAVVARLRPSGDAFGLDRVTYLGGSFDDAATGVGVEASGRVWVTGQTSSDDFPTRQPVQASYAGPLREMEGDGVLARLSADLATLELATYLGGSLNDQPTGLVLRPDGGAVIVGYTDSPDFPTTGGVLQPALSGRYDLFVSTLRETNGQLEIASSTYLGSDRGEVAGSHAALDSEGRVWMAGLTAGATFPTPGAAFGLAGPLDGVLVQLDANALASTTALGGNADDAISSLALGDGVVCTTGSTDSSDFPTQGGSSLGGLSAEGSAFLACFDTDATSTPAEPLPSGAPTEHTLHPGAPNPFVRSTRLRFDVVSAEHAVLTVYDATGRELATLVDGPYLPGRYAVDLDAQGWAPGIYLVRLRVADNTMTRSLTLLR
ncbi:MAG: hypothetical protein Rubg2KO_17400 [Rubricoccaceae bacterium]